MKDRNGKTLRKGDVCVVHFVDRHDKTTMTKKHNGRVCILDAIYKLCLTPIVCTMGENEDCGFFPDELEIIGDVRERAK